MYVCVCVCVCEDHFGRNIANTVTFSCFYVTYYAILRVTSKLLNDIPFKWRMVNGLQVYNFSVWLESHPLTQSIAFQYVNLIRLNKTINNDTTNQTFIFFNSQNENTFGWVTSKKDYMMTLDFNPICPRLWKADLPNN